MAGLLPKFIRIAPVNGEVVSGTVNGTNTTFLLANPPLTSNFIFILTLDGLIRDGNGVDYTLAGQTITMTTAPVIGQVLKAYYQKAT